MAPKVSMSSARTLRLLRQEYLASTSRRSVDMLSSSFCDHEHSKDEASPFSAVLLQVRCRGNLQALHLCLTWTAWCSPCSTTTTCTRSDTCIDSLVDRWARADAQASGANAGCMSEPRLDNAALSRASAMDTAGAWRLSHTEGVLDSVVGGREGEISSTCRQQVGRLAGAQVAATVHAASCSAAACLMALLIHMCMNT